MRSSPTHHTLNTTLPTYDSAVFQMARHPRLHNEIAFCQSAGFAPYNPTGDMTDTTPAWRHLGTGYYWDSRKGSTIRKMSKAQIATAKRQLARAQATIDRLVRS
jgi:hypothetical protein